MLQKRKFNQLVCGAVFTAIVCAAVVALRPWRGVAQMETVGTLKTVTSAGKSNSARNPAFTLIGNGELLLWWRTASLTGSVDKSIALTYAQLSNEKIVPSQKVINGVKSYSQTVDIHSIPKSSSVAVCTTLVGERRWSFDTAIQVIQQDKTVNSFKLESQLHTRLPFKTKGFPAPNPQAYWDVASMDPPVPIRDEYIQPQLTIASEGNPWYLVGIEGEAADTRGVDSNKVWFTKSLDGGVSWDTRKMLNAGSQPFLVEIAPKNLGLFYVQPPKGVRSSSQAIWPDDKLPGLPQEKNWPVAGALKMLHSTDGGQTWGTSQTIVNTKLVLQSASCIGSKGEVLLTYVQSDPNLEAAKRTSLWLTSSEDLGKSWTKPLQLTDGQYLDREPTIIEHEGKILVAFSRSGRGINTNIWLAEVDLK